MLERVGGGSGCRGWGRSRFLRFGSRRREGVLVGGLVWVEV